MKTIYIKNIKIDDISTFYDRVNNNNCFILINEQMNNYYLKFVISGRTSKNGEIKGFREFKISFYKKDIYKIMEIIEKEQDILEIDFSNLYLNEFQLLKNEYNDINYIKELQKRAKKELIINGKSIKFRKLVDINKFNEGIEL